jgi:hypothetical protein
MEPLKLHKLIKLINIKNQLEGKTLDDAIVELRNQIDSWIQKVQKEIKELEACVTPDKII